MRALRAAALACALVAAVHPAAAEDSETPTDAQKEEAKRHFLDGRVHYTAGEFADAADHFAKAYDLTGAPELLYDRARCYERLGEEERAAKQYEMYLRVSPDAEDRVEVERRIAQLAGEPTPKPAEEGEGREAAPAAPEEEGSKIRLRVASGVDFPITGEWSRKSIPLDVALLFGMNDWLHLGFGLAFVGFIGDEPTGRTGFPTGEFAVLGELAVHKTIKGRFAFAARIDIAPTWIFRDHRDSVFWLAARGGVGIHIDLWKSFGVVIEGVAAVGPVFNRDAEIWDDWPKVSLSADAGPRIGITYVF